MCCWARSLNLTCAWFFNHTCNHLPRINMCKAPSTMPGTENELRGGSYYCHLESISMPVYTTNIDQIGRVLHSLYTMRWTVWHSALMLTCFLFVLSFLICKRNSNSAYLLWGCY